MTRKAGRSRRWWAAAVVPLLFWGCSGTTQDQGSGGDGFPFGSGGFFVGGSGGFFEGGSGGFFPGSGGIGDDLLACGVSGSGGTFGGGSGGSTGFVSSSAPEIYGLTVADAPPPPISGGTLLVLANGTTAVASDPDRDQIYVIDLGSGSFQKVTLQAGDQPGRLVQDGVGLVHVVLRGSGALATIDPSAAQVTLRRSVCATPRGIAFSAARGLLYLACASGDLMAFTPTGTAASSTWSLDQDLRDVVIDGDSLMVTRFRSAEVLEVDPATGTITERQRPASFSNQAVHEGSMFEPAVAWRAAAMPDGGMVMVHQRGMNDRVAPTSGGYGGPDPCGSIVHTCVSRMKRGMKAPAGPAFPSFVLPVDIAVSPDGARVAVVAAGNGHAPEGTVRRLFIAGTDDVTQDWSGGCGTDDKHGPSPFEFCGGTGGSFGGGTGGFVGSGGAVGSEAGSITGDVTGSGGSGGGSVSSGAAGTSGSGGTFVPTRGSGGADATIISEGTGGSFAGIPVCVADPVSKGEPIAVAYAGADTVLVQTREPAQLLVIGGASSNMAFLQTTISLSSESREDTGHALFHSNSGGGLACASCHPEGHDDGRVWTFDCEGSRRTQDPSGGLLGTAPFHWNGDMTDFPTLFANVFVQRMSGPTIAPGQVNALQGWVNQLPTLPPLRSASDSQVAHGQALFQSPSVGCASCHTGATFTNNMTVFVGTGQNFQVPSLRGVGWRAPYMHDGCAATLSDRFTDATCGGGDQHGVTSQLSSSDRDDLIAYLQSL